MYIKVNYGFGELYANSWSGAKDTLDTIANAGKTDELMELLEELLEETFCDDCPTATYVNDYLWFDADEIFELLGISQE